tara:strand:- start:299 stop:580 length:282 start_codon:yes stop_codon:yes gene_type:complete
MSLRIQQEDNGNIEVYEYDTSTTPSTFIRINAVQEKLVHSLPRDVRERVHRFSELVCLLTQPDVSETPCSETPSDVKVNDSESTERESVAMTN